jgi:hypothetical protein
MSDKAHEMVNEKVDKKPIRKPKNKSITLYNPFLILDFISPVCKQEFDKDLLKYIDIETTEYTNGVFVFDVKEVRIKYFHEYMVLMNNGKKEEMTPTLKVLFTDGSELLIRQRIDDFVKYFLPEYLLKLHECYSEYKDENKQNVR